MPCEIPPVLSAAMLPPLAPVVIDSLAFARGGLTIEGSIPLARLPRLADELLDRSGSLEIRLHGWQSASKAWLRLEIHGNIMVRCQRCLKSVSLPLGIDGTLQLIAPGETWPDDDLVDDGADAIAADEELDVRSLIEDEVLLALPIAPLHAQCELPLVAGNEYGSSSFAALAALKKH